MQEGEKTRRRVRVIETGRQSRLMAPCVQRVSKIEMVPSDPPEQLVPRPSCTAGTRQSEVVVTSGPLLLAAGVVPTADQCSGVRPRPSPDRRRHLETAFHSPAAATLLRVASAAGSMFPAYLFDVALPASAARSPTDSSPFR